ncbi:MAG: response regulator [Oscillospiraceae bacterium]|nr:response regulator [Oscillospiraceae bacterium]
MEKKRLLIVDSNPELCFALRSVLQDEFCIQVAHGGKEALALLDSFKPEVLVLDVILSGLDGIRLLEYAAERGHKLKTLVTTAVDSDYVFNKLAQLEVSYILLKPCNLRITAERVREIADECNALPAQSGEQKLSAILMELGWNPKHNGYHYLCTAVTNFVGNNTQSLTKELYAAVGAVYGVSWQQVERSIRSALESAWKSRDEKLWQHWFPGASALKRPTSGEVICRLAELLIMDPTRKIG